MYIPPTIKPLLHLSHLSARQTTTTTSTSQPSCSGVSSGGIAGIVLGTFFGTLLLLYFIQTVRGANKSNNIGYVVEERDRKVSRRGASGRSGGGSGRRRRSTSVREVREVRRPSKVYGSTRSGS